MTQSSHKSRTGTGSGPEVYVGAFGKHPGWNDFIDDLGLETDRLISLKRILFLEGIAPSIDSGAWDKLEESQRTEGFHHIIVWRTRSDVMVCRLWSSSDGKGRTKYPMVVAAQVRGAPIAWILSEVLPQLEQAESRCRSATAAEQVISVLDETRRTLRSRAAALGSTGGEPISTRAVAEVADAIQDEDGRQGFYRLLYQIERDWSPYLPRRSDSGGPSRTWNAEIRPQLIRVPTGSGGPAEVIRRWMHFTLSMADASTPVTLMLSTEGAGPGVRWADVIVGEPGGAQFFCLRASDKSVPLATHIPYSLDPTFIARCDKRIEESRSGQGENSGTSSGAGTADRPGVISRFLNKLSGGQKKGLLVIAIAGGLVGIGGAILWSLSGDSGNGGGRGGTDSPGPIVDTGKSPKAVAQAPPPPVTPVETGDWAPLCAAYQDWFALFLQRLEKAPTSSPGGFKTRWEYYATDPYLGPLVAQIKDAAKTGQPIDPWGIANVAKGQDLSDLAKSPPAAALTPAAKEQTSKALKIVRGFSTGITQGEWPAMKAVDSAAAMLDRADLKAEAAYVKGLASAVDVRKTPNIAPGIDAVLGASRIVQDLERRLAIREECAKAAAMTGDPVLAAFPVWGLQATKSESGGPVDLDRLQRVSASLAKVEEVARPLLSFLKEGWPKTDTALLASKTSGLKSSAASPTPELFMSWLDTAKATPKLDESSDPRKSSQAAALVAQVATLRDKLATEFKAQPDANLLQAQVSSKKLYDELAGLPFNADTRARLTDGLPRVERELREIKQGLENALAVEGARRAGSAKEVRNSLAAQQSIVSKSEAVNAAWRSGRDALLASFDDARYAQLRVDADQLRSMLVEFESSIPAGLDATDGVEGAIALETWAERDRRIAAVLRDWKGQKNDPKGADLMSARERAAPGFKSWVEEATRAADSLKEAQELLRGGYGMSDKGPRGMSAAELIATWNGAAIASVDRVKGAVGPALGEMNQLDRINAMTSASELRAVIGRSTEDSWTTALAAWRRLGALGTPAWPKDVAQLDEEKRIESTLGQWIAARGGSRREALMQEVTRERSVRWTRCFGAATDAAAVQSIAAMASDFGIDPTKLPPRLAFNYKIATALRAFGSASMDDAQAKSAAGRLLKDIEELQGVPTDRPGIKERLTEIADLIRGDAPAKPKIDVTKLGPGALAGTRGGWVGETVGSTLRFTKSVGSDRVTLTFMRFETPSGEAFFLGATEVTLGVCVALIEQADAWKSFRSMFPAADTSDDLRTGPRVWRWTEGKGGATLRPAEKWLREVATGRPVPDSPPGLSVGTPSLGHPMNYVPPDAALFVAELAGCRLPTPAEWSAAYAAVKPSLGTSELASKANLRDQSWKNQLEYVRGLAKGGVVNWPDADTFVPSAQRGKVKVGGEAIAEAWTDGVVWLKPVGDGASDQIDALVGNVAEFVVQSEEDPIAPNQDATALASAVKRMTQSKRTSIGVVGGSAMSPPELRWDALTTVDRDEASEGYADVGLRLAFSATGSAPIAESLSTRIAGMLSSVEFLKE